MVHRLLFLVSISCTALLAQGAEIHKCVASGGVSYQSAPCSGREAALPRIVTDAAQSPRPIATSSSTQDCGPRSRTATRLPWRQATICIGMTDDEVLNLPGWGRPTKIVRAREPGKWRERWTYDNPAASPRQLQFVNGALAAVETEMAEAPAPSLAVLTIR